MILTGSKVKSVDPDLIITEKINSGMLNELLQIVPTNRKVRYLKREIISASPGNTTQKINLETIGTYSTKLLFAGGSNKSRMLSEAASAVLLKQSFSEFAAKAQTSTAELDKRDVGLKYFSNYKGDIPHGTLQRINNVISEYKKQGITPGHLRKEVQSLNTVEKNKGEDIANIYENYIKKCNKLSVKEIGDIYYELNKIEQEEFESLFRKLYPDVKIILLNGFDEFTGPEIEIINSSSNIRGVELYILFDYYNYNPLIFSHLDSCYNKLIAKGFQPVVDKSQAGYNKFQNDVREKLFLSKNKNKIDGYRESITKICAADRIKEIELTAKEIKNLISEKGIEPGKICVTFNLIQKYSPVVRDILSLNGIPFNLTDRVHLSSSPPIIALINYLEVLENDYYYRNIFRALSSGYLKIKNIDSSNLLKASVNLKIISGYENWVNSLNEAIERNDEYDDEEESSRRISTEIYRRALNDIRTIHENLMPFAKSLSLKEFRENIFNLIYSMNIPQMLVNEMSDATEENIKAFTSLLDLLDELLELFNLEYGSAKKFNLSFYLNNIRTAVSTSRFNIKEKPGYGVQVTTLNEIRGLTFDYLFICGLCDGDLPTFYSPEIFFSGSYVRGEIIHQTEERYRFYQSLCSWKKHLYFTFPQKEENKELVESSFLNEFSELFSVNIKDESSYSNYLYNREELLVYLGEKIRQGEPLNLDEEKSGINIEELKHSIEVSNLRMNLPFEKSEFTGYLNDSISAVIKNKLNEFKDTEFSISQLQTYAKCPYKYFAERVLNLEPVKEPTEEIEALEMGSLLHNILFKFYKEITGRGIVLRKVSGLEQQFAENLIFQIAEKEIENANFNSPLTFFEKEKILGINGQRKHSILYKFLIEEIEKDDGYKPEYFESGFGNIKDDNKDLAQVQNIKAGEVYVRGKIDRIDLNFEEEKYKVIDYKLSGSKPANDDLTGGISLQLPLYLFAAKEMIKAQLNKDFAPASAEIYSLKFDDKDFGSHRVSQYRLSSNTPDQKLIDYNEELINICLKTIEKYVKLISTGIFNLSTLKDRENKVCRYCGFRSICRIQEVE